MHFRVLVGAPYLLVYRKTARFGREIIKVVKDRLETLRAVENTVSNFEECVKHF